MKIAAYIVAALTFVLCCACITAKQKRKSWEYEQVVYLPFIIAAVGMVCGGLFSIPTVVCAYDGDWAWLAFGLFVLLCDSMMVGYLNCVILYDDKGFLARNFLGIRRQCSYGEVDGIRFGKDRWVYFQGHSVLIDGMCYGGDEFIHAIDKGYRKATGKWVPSIKRKFDPMNGHLDYPWAYFILWVVLGLFFVALPVFVYFSMTSETDPEDIVIHNVQFSSYEVDHDSLELFVDGEEVPYEIGYYEAYASLPDLEALCSGERFSVGVEGNGHYVISLTDSSGIRYITPESERQVYREEQKIATWIICALSPAGIYFCYMGIAVARHPERYSERVRRLFYKDGCLH